MKSMNVEKTAYWLIAPSIVVLLGFVGSFLYSVGVSFTRYSFINPVFRFSGLFNYVTVITSTQFWRATAITLGFTVFAVGVELVLGMALALALFHQTRGKGLMRALLILPLMVPPVLSSLIWKLMMYPAGGLLNYLLSWAHIHGSQWLAGTQLTVIASIALIDMWIYTPFVTLILLAGLQSIPTEPLEAAVVDGANSREQFLHITLPMLVPYIMMALIFRVIGALHVFTEIYATTQGGPGTESTSLSVAIYKIGFQGNELAMAMAIGVIMFAGILILTNWLVKIWRMGHV